MATSNADKAAQNEPLQLPTAWERLRAAFDPTDIGEVDMGSFKGSYVGHAAVTDRLLSVDPMWNWEPLALDAEGLPLFETDDRGNPIGLWIRLTVNGKAMLGYGDCKPSSSAPKKELLGDAIRNAAMRFGVALDLWKRSRDGAGATEGEKRGGKAAPQGLVEGAFCPMCQALKNDPEVSVDVVMGKLRPAKGGRHMGRLQCSGKVDGQWANHMPELQPTGHVEDAVPLDELLNSAVTRLGELVKADRQTAEDTMRVHGWDGSQRSVEWIRGMDDRSAILRLISDLNVAVRDLRTEIPL